MRKLLYFAVLAGLLVLDWSAASAASKKKAPAKKTTATHQKSTHSTTSSHKSSSHHSTASRKSSSRKRTTTAKRRPATTWRNRQTTPTPDRYKEIQEALAAKGYLSPEEANGVWGFSSTVALKRFQAEQNIEANGKINSLSLIALGLGPKHDATKTP